MAPQWTLLRHLGPFPFGQYPRQLLFRALLPLDVTLYPVLIQRLLPALKNPHSLVHAVDTREDVD
jgi:hypothetical protein